MHVNELFTLQMQYVTNFVDFALIQISHVGLTTDVNSRAQLKIIRVLLEWVPIRNV